MGKSLLVSIDGMDGIAMAEIDHAFSEVELPSGRTAARPGDDVNFGSVFVSESPETRYVELNLRDRLDAADARTMASCAVM